MIQLILLVVALIVAAIRIGVGRGKLSAQDKLGAVLSSIIFFNIGVMGLIAFYAHAFRAAETAQMIGWQPGSPFQFEIAVANLGLGIIGVLSPFFSPSFWLATVIFAVTMMWGCAYGHYVQLQLGDTAPWNSGLFLWFGDFALPAIYGLLMAAYYLRYGDRK